MVVTDSDNGCTNILLMDQVVNGIQEEWEVELEKLTAKFERELSKKKGSRED